MTKKFMRSVFVAAIVAVSECLVLSCTNEVTYEAPQFAKINPQSIKVLNDEYMFKYGDTPMVVDSLLVMDTGNNDNYIAVFNRHTGDLVQDFGRKGPGPNELIRPTTFSVDKMNHLLYVCDWGKQALLQYDLLKIHEEGIPKYNSFNISEEFVRTSIVRFLRDSLFYAPAFKEGRILVGVPSEVRWTIDSETPDVNKFPTQEDWYNYMKMQSVTAVRPDGRFLAAGSALGGILEIFDLNSRKRVVLKHFYEPIFEQREYMFLPTPETIGGFAYLAATEKYLYATLHGKVNPTSMPSSICQFDWNGNPIAQYDCGEYAITSFTVTDNDEIIYAVAIGDEREQILLEIKL